MLVTCTTCTCVMLCFHVLCTDYESDLLFWIDTKQHVVFSSDLNGRKRSILLTSSHFLRHSVAISVFEVIFARYCLSSSSAATLKLQIEWSTLLKTMTEVGGIFRIIYSISNLLAVTCLLRTMMHTYTRTL